MKKKRILLVLNIAAFVFLMLEVITGHSSNGSDLLRIANIGIPACILFGTQLYVLLTVLREDN